MISLAILTIVLASARFSHARCGDVLYSPDGKTQSIGACVDNTASKATVSLGSGVAHLNLTGSVFLGTLECLDSADLTTITAPNLTTIDDINLRNLSSLSKIDMPNLITAINVTIDRIGDATLPQFSDIRQSLNLAGSSVEALAAWSQQMGGVEVTGNGQLHSLSFPMLRDINGDLRIDANSQLEDLSDAFPLLEEVKGAVLIRGNISSLKFPKLRNVEGGVEVNGTTSLDCGQILGSLQKLGVNPENSRCSNNLKSGSGSPAVSATASSASSTPATTTSVSSPPPPGNEHPSSRSLGMGLGMGLGLPLILVSIVLLCLRRRKPRRETNRDIAWEKPQNPGGSLPGGVGSFDSTLYGPESLSQALHVENPRLSVLSATQVRRSGSKFREHGLHPDGEDEMI